MNVPQIIILVLLLASMVAPRKFQVYLLFFSQSFSAMAVVPPEWLGGTSITPGSLAAFLFIFRSLTSTRIVKSAFESLLNINRLGWLGGFFIIAAAGAVILPQIFSGEIMVYGLRQPFIGPVMPSITNFTQTGYLFISVFLAAIISAYLQRSPDFIETLLKGIFIGGCTILITGFVDIAANATGNGAILKMFYTADYSYSAGEIMGARRVLGLTPEPSAFGAMSVGFAALLLFLRPVYPRNLWRWKVPAVGWGCAVMAFLSTSSAAYACMFVLLGLYLFYNIHNISKEGRIVKKTVVYRTIWMFGIGGLVLILGLFSTDVINYFVNMVDTLIFQKHNTESYIERSSWTVAGLKAFVESFGLGVGIGSVRTSNFFANIIASTGFFGTLLFSIFLAKLYRIQMLEINCRQGAIVKGAKLALAPMLVTLFLVGTTPDFGVMPAILFGMISGIVSSESRNRTTPLIKQNVMVT